MQAIIYRRESPNLMIVDAKTVGHCLIVEDGMWCFGIPINKYPINTAGTCDGREDLEVHMVFNPLTFEGINAAAVYLQEYGRRQAEAERVAHGIAVRVLRMDMYTREVGTGWAQHPRNYD